MFSRDLNQRSSQNWSSLNLKDASPESPGRELINYGLCGVKVPAMSRELGRLARKLRINKINKGAVAAFEQNRFNLV